MNVKEMTDAMLTGRAIGFQHVAELDFRNIDKLHHPDAKAMHQGFHADASAKAREALFELIERNKP